MFVENYAINDSNCEYLWDVSAMSYTILSKVLILIISYIHIKSSLSFFMFSRIVEHNGE